MIEPIERRPLISRLLEQFTHLMACLLWAAGLVAFAGGMPELAVAIWLVNAINGLFSYWQEHEAGRAIAALQAVLPVRATVVRDGTITTIAAGGLVPGDLVVLTAGDRISADGYLVDSGDLQVSQAALTGESAAVPKTIEGAAVATPDAGVDAARLVFAGTDVLRGTGRFVVTGTGMATELGRIAHLTRAASDRPSPLQVELELVTRRIAMVAIAIGLGIYAGATLLVGTTPAQGFVYALGMIVAFVPEGLLPTTTLSLAMAVGRMAKRNAIVKRLSSIETLGCTTVICTDKTGTLTENKMTVEALLAGGVAYRVSGEGYSPEGSITPAPTSPEAAADLRDLLAAAALCNDARLMMPDRSGDGWQAEGDPTEAALLVAAMKGGLVLERLAGDAPRLGERPFDSERKRMTTLHDRAGQTVALVKGAPDAILACCTNTRLRSRDEPLDDSGRHELAAAVDALAGEGLRVLAVAERRLQPSQEVGKAADVDRDLTLLGLAAMHDPPRPGVREAIERCRIAGIRVLMLTGDHPRTAEGIARRIGLPEGDRIPVLSSGDLEAMDDPTLREMLAADAVFARVTPAQKLRIVQALQAAGNVVAVTGDGVNDAPALKCADIGIAMGRSGTDVAREAADMVLVDDHFATIVDAIEEGRTVYDNIRRFVTYVFNSNVAEAAPFALTVLSRGMVPLPLTIMQVLAIDLGTDMVPAIGLGSEPAAPGVMARPPRSRQKRLLSPGVLALAFCWYGLLEAVAGLTAYFFVNWQHGWPAIPLAPAGTDIYRQATTAVLAAIVSSQIGAVLGCRTRLASLREVGLGTNHLVLWGIVTEVTLLLALVYLPSLQHLFGTAPLAWIDWGFILIWAPIVLVADEARKALERRI